MSSVRDKTANEILSGNTSLGIELGSTRIKATLIGSNHLPIASGSHEWENKLVDGIWTYDLEDVWLGLRDCYAKLKGEVLAQYGATLERIGGIGISAMMHGYLVFDKDGKQLVPFRTWRNTITAEASAALIDLFQYPIPHRWSISHLYQAVLNRETHVADISHMTTLAGFVHWRLTGEKVVGIGEASGMFPIDIAAKDFNQVMVDKFNELIAGEGFPWTLKKVLPKILLAGECAGVLTEEGAKLLDPAGDLKSGIPLCAPEGDAGTGMVATNSVAQRTGNVSAGTSIFLMAVLEKELQRVHPEIDLVTTPAGDLVAMVHCNNCTGDIDAWVRLFAESYEAAGVKLSKTDLYELLYKKALEADADCGDLMSYNYISGESITDMDEGRPLFVRKPDSRFTLANFMRTHFYSALSTLKIGLNILLCEESVKIDKMFGHGGFFKVDRVGQQIAAAAVNAPVTLMPTAGEGGPWGMALLAAYMRNKDEQESLQDYLNKRVFCGFQETTVQPLPEDVKGFEIFIERYKKGLSIEQEAVKVL